MPDDWKKILIAICKEIEESVVVNPPTVRNVCTFQSAAMILKGQENTVSS